MQRINSLLALAPKTDSFLIDMWGVLWDGQQFYPGALNMLAELKKAGKGIAILSNTTQLGHLAAESNKKRGLIPGVHTDMFITSGDLCFENIQKGLMTRLAGKEDYRYAVIGAANPQLFAGFEDRETTDIAQADVVYLSGCGKALTIDEFVPQLQQSLDRKLPTFCANPDYSCMIGGVEHPANGALGKWYEERGGTVLWMGKPYTEIYRYALGRTGFDADRTLMIGDTLRTDIEGGKSAGIQTVLLTGTGITAKAIENGQKLEAILKASNIEPDYVLDTFASRVNTLERRKDLGRED